MSIKLISKAFDYKVNDALTKLILVKLADNANDDGECFPSYRKIAEQCEVSRSTVMRKIKSLEESGQIQVQRRKSAKGNSSNIFILSCLLVEQCHHPSSSVPPGVVSASHHPSSSLPPITINEPSILTVTEPKKHVQRLAERENPAVEEIFDFWKSVMKSPRSKLDAKRKSAIAKALKDYSAEELRQAIIGCSKTSWNMGENPGGKLYNQITLIFRDSDRIERFITAADDDFTERNKNAHKTQRTQAHTHGEKLQEEYRRFLHGHETAGEQNNQRFLAKNDCNLQPGLVEYDDDLGF